MTEMMPAVLLDEQRQFVFGQRPVPQPRPDQVLVGVDLCGICGSDLHAADLPQVYRGGFLLGQIFLIEPAPERRAVQQPCHAARAEDQLLVFDPRNVCLQRREEIATNPIEPGVEPIPSLWRVDCDPRDDTDDGEITTSHYQRAHHRPSEGRRYRLERGLGTQRADRVLMSIQVALQRVLDRRVTERFQRAKVVAHCRDVGLSDDRKLSQSHAILTALSQQLQRRVHQPRARPQTGLATLVRSCRVHRRLIQSDA
jgi:hypothetical protein